MGHTGTRTALGGTWGWAWAPHPPPCGDMEVTGTPGTRGDKGTHTEIGGRGKGHTDVQTPNPHQLIVVG